MFVLVQVQLGVYSLSSSEHCILGVLSSDDQYVL